MDETALQQRMHSYVEANEPPMATAVPELVARGRQAEGRRRFALGTAAVAAVVGLAAVGLAAVTQTAVSFDPAGGISFESQSLDERMDDLIRSNMPRKDELQLKQIKAFRWDEPDPLPTSRLDEATSWEATYNLDTGNDYIQQIRVILGYYPLKQWPPVVDGACRYPYSDVSADNEGDRAILYYWGRMARDLRAPAKAGPPLEPGYLVSVDAMEQGYNTVLAPQRASEPGKVNVPSQGNGDAKGGGDGGPMTGGYSWEHQRQVATDPDLVFDPPETWPDDVVNPKPLTKDERLTQEIARKYWDVKDGC